MSRDAMSPGLRHLLQLSYPLPLASMGNLIMGAGFCVAHGVCNGSALVSAHARGGGGGGGS